MLCLFPNHVKNFLFSFHDLKSETICQPHVSPSKIFLARVESVVFDCDNVVVVNRNMSFRFMSFS